MAQDQNDPNTVHEGLSADEEVPRPKGALDSFVASMRDRLGCTKTAQDPIDTSGDRRRPTFSNPLPVVVNPEPGVRQCNWSQFKNRHPSTPTFSIETLVAGSNLNLSVYDESVARGQRGPPEEAREELSSRMEAGISPHKIHRIRIQSAIILHLLNTVTGDLWDITKSHTFLRPFAYLIHHQQKVKDKFATLSTSTSVEVNNDSRSEISNNKALQDIRAYIDFVDRELLPLYRQFEDISDGSRTISFDDLWYLLRPGELVWCPWKRAVQDGDSESLDLPGRQNVFRVYSIIPHIPFTRHRVLYDEIGLKQPTAERAAPGVAIASCYYLDYDGEKVIPIVNEFEIRPFSGLRRIEDLVVFPVRFLPDWDQKTTELKRRGELFLNAIQMRHVRYKGTTLLIEPSGDRTQGWDGEPMRSIVDYEGDVFVDFGEAFYEYPRWRLKHHRMEPPAMLSSTTIEPYRVIQWDGNGQDLESHYEVVVRNDDIGRFEGTETLSKDRFLSAAEFDLIDVKLTEEDALLLPLRVYGFIIPRRTFRPLDVRGIAEVEYNPSALEELDLDTFHKKTIESLVYSYFKDRELSNKHHVSKKAASGKERGLVILIQGPPGVGKTATAQAVAQVSRCPLFTITLEDAEDYAAENFRQLFRRVELWGGIVLLDEVDVYLAYRDVHDMRANLLVTLFLHVLENFKGIIFLTTNRPGILDEAVKSRAHATFCYQPLNLERTLQVFQLNINKFVKREESRHARTGEDEMVVVDQDILDFARGHYLKHCQDNELTPWNGRQIANAFSIAASIARYQVLGNAKKAQPQLRKSHFEDVERLTEEYDRARFKVNHKSDSSRAQELGERYDRYEYVDEQRHGREQNDVSSFPPRLQQQWNDPSSSSYTESGMRLVPRMSGTTGPLANDNKPENRRDVEGGPSKGRPFEMNYRNF